MDNKLLLAKSLTLLYRESQLEVKSENSADLVRTVLQDVHAVDIGVGINNEREITNALKSTILEMCDQPYDHTYDKADVLQRIRINTGNDDKYYEAIRQGIDGDIQEASLKRSIVNIRNAIHNHFREKQIKDALNKAAATFNYDREKIKDVGAFITDFVTTLESLQLDKVGKDPAIIDEIDVGDDASMKNVFTNIKDLSTGGRVYRTGWQSLNKMLQGGFRPGETWITAGLQHKYKTGFSLSIFAQIAQFNKPHTTDPTKKPLLLRISLEDALVNNLQFLYQYLKYDETRQFVDVKEATVDDMREYVKNKLQVNGFHVKMSRADPTQWTYKSLCNKVLEYEAQGYSIEVLDIDYLSLLPTIGCVSTGPTGTDVLDLLRRMRNFCSKKGIVLLTPWQLSTEAKILIRGGVPEDQFVKEIAEKGYFDRTRALDREFDGALLIHLFKHKKETYFTVQRDKHRLTTIIPESDKYYMQKFPKGMPIPSDVDRENSAITRMGGNDNMSDDDGGMSF